MSVCLFRQEHMIWPILTLLAYFYTNSGIIERSKICTFTIPCLIVDRTLWRLAYDISSHHDLLHALTYFFMRYEALSYKLEALNVHTCIKNTYRLSLELLVRTQDGSPFYWWVHWILLLWPYCIWICVNQEHLGKVWCIEHV